MIARCVLCGRLIWPWQRSAWWIRTNGGEVRWHASHDARPRPAPEPDVIVGYLNVDGSGQGNWTAYEGLSPLEQLHADGDR